jgi:hypothetical protein
MQAEHPSHAEQLHDLMTLRHADMVREQLSTITPAIWKKRPTGPKENSYFGEKSDHFFWQRIICLTRGNPSNLATITVRKQKQATIPNEMLRQLLPEIQILPPNTTARDANRYLVLPSGFIIPYPDEKKPVQQIVLPEALYIYGFLLGVQQTLDELH